MDKNTRINGKNTYKPQYETDLGLSFKKEEKLIDFKAPENSLVLTPLMSRKEASEMFYEWAKNTYGEYFWAYDHVPTWQSVGDENISDSEDWKGIKLGNNT